MAKELFPTQLFRIGNEYKCFGGEKKILSPWKPNSSKSTLKPIEYFFTPDT